MRNLIWLGLALIFVACSGQAQTFSTPSGAPQGLETKIPTSENAVPTAVPTSIATTSAESASPDLSPTPIPTVISTPIATGAATRASSATGSGPVCNRAPDARTVAEGELGSASNPIVIGLVEYMGLERTEEAGAQLAACLQEINGLAYAALVGVTERETVDALASGESQLAFLGALSSLYGQQEFGFETGLVILRTEDDKLQPYTHREFLANKASGIKTLEQVKGKTFCFGEPDNILNTIQPKIVLGGNGVDTDTDLKASKYLGYADTIAMAVYRGECDAGSGYTDILTFPGEALQTYPDLAEKVETFYVSDPIPNDGVQYTRGLDDALQEATTAALLKMAADNPGKHPPLQTLYKIEGFVRAGNDFYREFGELVKRAGVDLAQVVQ